MGIKDDVKAVIDEFEKENPKLAGKVKLTSSNRSWKDQLDIILQPRQAKNYKNIKADFLKTFKLDKLPAKRSAMEADQLAWWEKNIMKQAGKSPGFPHIGGKAQDIVVAALGNADKKTFDAALKKAGIKILYEYVAGSKADYNVSLSKANVFHCTK